ncbi:MAG: hypothetical protein GY714_10495 [Desulfobacterales bacterium]|nr:hypothetical protein [Desulfobacterales bacterium]
MFDDVAFDGIGISGVTMLAANAVDETSIGKTGKVSAAKTIDLCSAEDRFYCRIGQVDKEAGILTAERTGIQKFSYSGSISAGDRELVADGSGGVKEPTTAGTGTIYHVLDVDDVAKVLYLDRG